MYEVGQVSVWQTVCIEVEQIKNVLPEGFLPNGFFVLLASLIVLPVSISKFNLLFCGLGSGAIFEIGSKNNKMTITLLFVNQFQQLRCQNVQNKLQTL